MRRLLLKVSYFFFWLLGAFFYLLPFSVKQFSSRVLAKLWFSFFPFRRRIILHNLSLVFWREKEEDNGSYQLRIEKLARANFSHCLLCLCEIFERFHWGPEQVRRRVKWEGRENLDPLIKRKQGYFFLTAHIGNWEMISLVGVLLGVPLSIISKYLRNDFFEELWVQSRKAYGLELIEERKSAAKIMRAIRAGRAVGFILDQYTGPPHGMPAVFLGRETSCPKGLAILSQKLRAPVVPVYLIRQNDGTFVLHLEKELAAPEEVTGTRFKTNDERFRAHIELCNRNMEKWIRLYPEQYLWLHRRFKDIHNYSSPLPWEL